MIEKDPYAYFKSEKQKTMKQKFAEHIQNKV